MQSDSAKSVVAQNEPEAVEGASLPEMFRFSADTLQAIVTEIEKEKALLNAAAASDELVAMGDGWCVFASGQRCRAGEWVRLSDGKKHQVLFINWRARSVLVGDRVLYMRDNFGMLARVAEDRQKISGLSDRVRTIISDAARANYQQQQSGQLQR